MSHSHLTISLRWRPAALAAFVIALQVGLSDSAEATCGDWLAHDSQAGSQADAEHLPQPDVPSPCSSGQCRKAPAPLPGSPQRSMTVQPDQWGTLDHFALRLSPSSDRMALDVTLNVPEGLRLRPERPPRS